MDDEFKKHVKQLESSLNCEDEYKNITSLLKQNVFPKESTGSLLLRCIERDCLDKNKKIRDECLNTLGIICRHKEAITNALNTILTIAQNKQLPENVGKRLFETLQWLGKNVDLEENDKKMIAKLIRHIYFLIGSLASDEVCEILLDISNRLFDFDCNQNSLQCNSFIIEAILGLTYHKTIGIRKKSCEALKKQFDSCRVNEEMYENCYAKLANPCIQAFTSYQKFLSNKEIKMYEILTQQIPLLLSFYGINIRRKGRLINSVLSLLEKGFAYPNENVRLAAFRVWHSLIGHFATHLDVLTSERYLKLLMQPLVSSNLQNQIEKLSTEKIKTFWHLVCCVEGKIFELFNQVCLPLLYICLGSFAKSSSTGSNSSLNSSFNRRSSLNESKFLMQLANFGFTAGKTIPSKHLSSQLCGIEILVHLLNSSNQNEMTIDNISLPPLKISTSDEPKFFPRYSLLFIESCNEVFKFLGHKAPIDLLMHLWGSLNKNVKHMLEEVHKKKKTDSEVFKAYFSLVKNTILEQRVPQELCMHMINDCSNFPASILSSTFYGNSSGAMASTPASSLLKITLSKSVILSSEADNTKVITSSKLLLQYAMKDHQVFRLLKSLINLYKGYNDEAVNLTPSQINILLATWDKLAFHTSEMIRNTQEINEGDAADHDFTTMYDMMFIPFNILHCQQQHKTCSIDISNWKSLYNSILWASSFVSTCKSNEVEHEVLQRFDQNVDDLKTENPASNFMLSAIEAVVEGMSPLTELLTTGLEILDFLNTLLEVILDFGQVNHIKRFLHCIVELFKKKMKEDTICLAFIRFITTLVDIICYIEDGSVAALKTVCIFSVKSILKSVLASLHQNKFDISDKLMKSKDWNDFLKIGLGTSESEIKSSVAEFYHGAIVKQKTHAITCETYSDDMKSMLLPFYKEFHWMCPWEESQDENSDTDCSLQEISTNKLTPPHATYGAYASPVKKTLLSPFKKSPMKKNSLKTTPINGKTKKPTPRKTRSSKKSDHSEENGSKRKASSSNTEMKKKAKSTSKRDEKDSSFTSISKELDVTPLDDSYIVACVSDPDSSKVDGEETMDSSCENDLNNDTEYIAVADMSCGQSFHQTTMDQSQHDETKDADDSKNLSDYSNDKDASVHSKGSVASDCSHDKSTSSCYVKMVDMSCYGTPSTSINETKDDEEMNAETTLDSTNNSSGRVESDLEETKYEDSNINVSNLNETGEEEEESYVEMVDMSCHVAQNPEAGEEEEEESFVEMVDMSCHAQTAEDMEIPDSSDIPSESSDNSRQEETNKTADESEYVVMVDQSLNVTNPADESKNKNDSDIKHTSFNDVDNSLISEDRSEVFEEDNDVYSVAHSTCTFDSSPRMSEITSPITKDNKQSTTTPDQVISPSSKSILKRRSVVVSAENTPSPPKRRVSFAYPISISKAVEKVVSAPIPPKSPTSPRSPKTRRLSSPHSAHRRLHLPDGRKLNTELSKSPLSLRSAKVAAEIGKIRAKNGQGNNRLESLVEDDPCSNKTSKVDEIKFEEMSYNELISVIQKATCALAKHNPTTTK